MKVKIRFAFRCRVAILSPRNFPVPNWQSRPKTPPCKYFGIFRPVSLRICKDVGTGDTDNHARWPRQAVETRSRRVKTEQLLSEVLALDISLFERNIFFSFSYLRPSETSFPSRETPRRHRSALVHINAYS